MAAARFCISGLRAGSGLAQLKWGERGFKAAGKLQQRWTGGGGGALTTGIAVAVAAHSGAWMAAAPAPADTISDRKYVCSLFCYTTTLANINFIFQMFH